MLLIPPFFTKYNYNSYSTKKAPKAPSSKEKVLEKPLVKETFNFYNCRLGSRKLNLNEIRGLGIEDLHELPNNSLRGRTLSSKTPHHLQQLKKAGISTVIDLRGKDAPSNYGERCQKYGLRYFNFPLDFKETPSRKIIDNLGEFFKQMNNGNFYISCAQGLHRTDLALAINYVFNPNASKTPPVMWGAKIDNEAEMSKTFARLNDIYKNLTPQDRKKLHIKETFGEEEFKKRKAAIVEYTLLNRQKTIHR